MPHLLLFGPGYCGRAIAEAVARENGIVTTIGRTTPADEVAHAAATATHILSTVPPQQEEDPILANHRTVIKASGAWLGYLSSTGVYGDTGGAWVDETAPLNGRRAGRIAADRAWQRLGACVLRLPGIYGPGRSMLERVAWGRAHRVALPDQVFSRIHRDDIVGGVLQAMAEEATGIFNLADDEPASQNHVVEAACHLLGRAPPPLQSLDEAGLSPMARAFYAENRRVAAGKARRRLGWRPLYPTYREGLRALMASASPATASAAPAAATTLQR
jgi:nucleoside-diphosphate-sugar epimerase